MQPNFRARFQLEILILEGIMKDIRLYMKGIVLLVAGTLTGNALAQTALAPASIGAVSYPASLTATPGAILADYDASASERNVSSSDSHLRYSQCNPPPRRTAIDRPQ
ncbi:MAG TPA: hypothetical protein VGL72_00625 [Bryobacteraceae bacterium]